MRYIILIFTFLSFGCQNKNSLEKDTLTCKLVDSLLHNNDKSFVSEDEINLNIKKALIILGEGKDTVTREYKYKILNNAFYYLKDDKKNYLINYLNYGKSLKDSLIIGRYNLLKGMCLSGNKNFDSAFIYINRAEKIFKNLNSKNDLAESYLLIANNLININDFSGAEQYLLKAEIYLKNSKKTQLLRKFIIEKVSINNFNYKFDLSENLLIEAIRKGINGIEFQGYDRANLKKALILTYNANGKYLKSHEGYKSLLNDPFKGNTEEVMIIEIQNKLKLFKNFNAKKEYLKLIKLYNFSSNTYLYLISDFTDYLIKSKQFELASEMAEKNYHFSKKINSPYSVLNSLIKISFLNAKKSHLALIEYDSIIDELLIKQRHQKDNFYKIQLETNTIAQDKEKAEHQRNQVILAIGILMVFSAFLFIIYRNRLMNSKIEFQHKHQKSNEQIHELILKNQALEVEVRQKEQRRIAMEIHDGVLNQLASIRFKLFKLELNQEAQTIKEALYNVNTIQNIEVELRNLTHDLHAQSSNERIALLPIVQQLIQVHQEVYGIPIELYQDDWDWEQLSTEIKMGFTRIIQEALFNVVKHAKASKIEIHLHHLSNSILLSIKDNGKGMDLSVQSPGIGLENIHLRAEQIQAKVKITSEKNKGTQIQINTPV